MKNKIWYSDLSSDLSTPTAPNLVTEIVFDKFWYAAGSKRLYVFIAEICMKNKIWYSDHYSDLSTPTAPKKFTNLVTEIVFDKVWYIVGSKQ